MRRTAFLCCLLLLTLSIGHKAVAQDTPKAAEAPKAAEPPIHYYHLDFSIQEVGADGKATNSRSYSTTVTTDKHSDAAIRTGSRIPIATGATTASGDGKPGFQFQYLDVGVNIDVRSTREVDSQLALELSAEVSSLAEAPSPVGAQDPVVHQNYWRSAVLIPIGKSTVIFKSEALENKGGMQVVVTATRLQ